jgi:hypothetical protein
MHVAVASQGKINDLRVFNYCTYLLEWLDALLSEYSIATNNRYTLLRRILISLIKPEIIAVGLDYNIKFLCTYNFYLSQLKMCIEMAFGYLTPKWRLFCRTLNFKSGKNAKIARVCTTLHNYCVCVDQLGGGGRISVINRDEFDP